MLLSGSYSTEWWTHRLPINHSDKGETFRFDIITTTSRPLRFRTATSIAAISFRIASSGDYLAPGFPPSLQIVRAKPNHMWYSRTYVHSQKDITSSHETPVKRYMWFCTDCYVPSGALYKIASDMCSYYQRVQRIKRFLWQVYIFLCTTYHLKMFILY